MVGGRWCGCGGGCDGWCGGGVAAVDDGNDDDDDDDNDDDVVGNDEGGGDGGNGLAVVVIADGDVDGVPTLIILSICSAGVITGILQSNPLSGFLEIFVMRSPQHGQELTLLCDGRQPRINA